jgi:peptide/nickel transport system ATP-binding protein
MSAPVLKIRDLNLSFRSHSGSAQVLHGISLHINKGERVALVGESGSGKSVTARIILGMIQALPKASVEGLVEFEGRELSTLSHSAWHDLRGTRMSMIFQDPTSSLNPVYTIGRLFDEVLSRSARNGDRTARLVKAGQALLDVSINEPERVLASYPFQLSGGMNQRVMIAMALANEPALLIADEPGTALDVTVQAQTLAQMKSLVDSHGTAVLFISHNLGVVREFADRVYVIYKGRIVEHGPVQALFEAPRHPYTRALLAAVPRITGGGIPDIDDETAAFLSPAEIHEGYGEPEASR